MGTIDQVPMHIKSLSLDLVRFRSKNGQVSSLVGFLASVTVVNSMNSILSRCFLLSSACVMMTALAHLMITKMSLSIAGCC